jgi:hypothetical protein
MFAWMYVYALLSLVARERLRELQVCRYAPHENSDKKVRIVLGNCGVAN